ncbi:hypothetical protein [Allosphingosinicella sp.]|jgi:hypothetical protein|uniref:hypothetical protein n=1 Tax=Allosphingosinicella sp. TaxID=2823234 RepID=UPI002EDCC77E
MNREEMLGPAVSETGQVYEPGTGYKGMAFGAGIVVIVALKLAHSFGLFGEGGLVPPSLQSEIESGVAQVQAQLPIRLDDLTTVTGVSSTGTRILFSGRISEDIPTAEIPAAQADAQQAVRQILCDNPDNRALIGRGAIMAYRIVDPSGDRIELEVGSCRLPRRQS